jgi:hypothetical protein
MRAMNLKSSAKRKEIRQTFEEFFVIFAELQRQNSNHGVME